MEFPEINKLKTVAILTNFTDLNPGYSLTGIVLDQLRMLGMKGHKVVLFVNHNFFNPGYQDNGLDDIIKKYPNISVAACLPSVPLIDYESVKDLTPTHRTFIHNLFKTISKELLNADVDIVFTHDLIFTGWNMPYALAIQKVNESLLKVKWYHWVHSIPGGSKDWWNLEDYGPQHKIIFPNASDSLYVSNSFKTGKENVLTVPHIKDIRSWYDVSEDVWNITEELPSLLSADIIQIYPASSDRLSSKRVDVLLKIFGMLKKTKATVFLMIANQWATGRQRKEEIGEYIQLGEKYGLCYYKDFVFSSDIDEKYKNGLSKRVLRELQLFQNLFIFPTHGESFGLVGPEAAFTGSLVVTNRSLSMMKEILGFYAPSFDFGSFCQNTPDIEKDEYLQAIAINMLYTIKQNSAITTKIYCRKRYNMNELYYHFYLPLF